MPSRVGGYLVPREVPAPDASGQLEREGYAVLRGVLSARQLASIRSEILGIYADRPRDGGPVFTMRTSATRCSTRARARRSWWAAERSST